jgi:hypothetical protein
MTPFIQVYKIENGFLVEGRGSIDHNRVEAIPPAVTFAKDAAEVAELIVASAARVKLGIDTQYEMFTGPEMGAKASQLTKRSY